MKNYTILVEHFLGKNECDNMEEFRSIIKYQKFKRK